MSHNTSPYFITVFDICNISHTDSDTIHNLERDIAYMVKMFKKTDSTDKIFLGTDYEELTASVAVVLADSLDKLVECQAILCEGIWINFDLILEDMTTDGENIGNSGYCLKLA